MSRYSTGVWGYNTPTGNAGLIHKNRTINVRFLWVKVSVVRFRMFSAGFVTDGI